MLDDEIDKIYKALPQDPTKKDILIALKKAFDLGDKYAWAYAQDDYRRMNTEDAIK